MCDQTITGLCKSLSTSKSSNSVLTQAKEKRREKFGKRTGTPDFSKWYPTSREIVLLSDSDSEIQLKSEEDALKKTEPDKVFEAAGDDSEPDDKENFPEIEPRKSNRPKFFKVKENFVS